MQDDAEQALLALANPITWVWTPNNKGSGRWNGHVGQIKYRINSPRSLGDVDVPLIDRSWRLSVQAWQSGDYYIAPVPTVERAKKLCLNHALSGDISEIERLAEAGRVEQETFNACNTVALTLLTDLLQAQKPPPLKWQSQTPDDLEIYATSSCGTYVARFHPEHRWVVTFIGLNQTAVEHRFLTRLITGLACGLHAHTGAWHAVLPE